MSFYFWNCLWCPKCGREKTFHRMPKLICFDSLKGIIWLHSSIFPRTFPSRIHVVRLRDLNQNWFCWSRTVIFPGKPIKVLIKVYLNWLWSILKIKITTRCHFLESRPYKMDVTKTKYIKLMKIWNFSMRFYAEMNQNKWALQNEIILKILSIRKMYEFSQFVGSKPILNVERVYSFNAIWNQKFTFNCVS